MNSLEVLQGFGKGKKKLKTSGEKNAIIYTRVSSKEQTENLSLDVQLKGCENFTTKNNLQVKGIFGGTYESAQTDERNEFKRMVSFSKNYKQGISYIVVYSLERFSRTGENAIWLSRQLRELGITIISVTQPIDTSNPSGVLQQNILFLFGQYDNDLRRQKCIAGMKEKLLRGDWVSHAPVGYSYDRTNSKEQKIIINEKGKLIRKAFELKVYDKLSNTGIAERISKQGLKLNKKRISEIIKNPFYCGFLSHNLLEGQVVRGNHPAIISEKLFFQANEVLKESKANLSGEKQKKENDNTPLKRFVYCGNCGTPFTAYIVKKKNLYYYKCNTIGCQCNKSVKHLHNRFEELLSIYETNKAYVPALKDMLMEAYNDTVDKSEVNVKDLNTKVTELKQKLEKVEERFAYGEIDRDVYDKISKKLKLEIDELKEVVDQSKLILSNPLEVVNKTLEITSNLVNLWVSGDSEEKRNLQILLFPSGILYDRENDNYRTTEINSIITLTHSFSEGLRQNKNGLREKNSRQSALVVRTGIEPVLPE
ncbi:recombinase family protein [soil metagenome]